MSGKYRIEKGKQRRRRKKRTKSMRKHFPLTPPSEIGNRDLAGGGKSGPDGGNTRDTEYSVQLTFREQWLDERLRFNDFGGRLKYLTLTEANRVWMPDLFFSNEKEGHFHNIIMPNVYIRIFPNGSVLYSIRISLTLSCPMNLKLYPLDRQICSLRMASYGWTTNDLVFLWKEGDPVQVVKNLHLPRFTLEKFLTDYCNSKTNTGEYSCLKVDLLFKREFSYYLIQIYIPCCMLVIVSWVSFWLDQSAVPARVSLGVTTLLTMATQTSGINASLPPVSYTKAIDVWTGVCLTFVFGALLEFALVNYASRSDMHSDSIKKQFPASEMEHSSSIDPSSELLEPDGSANFAMKPLVRHPEDSMSMDKLRQCEIHMQPRKKNCCRSWLSKFPTRSKRIDVISRIFFPIVFAFFNLTYWSTYLFREEEEGE
ncbi:PREDICTED: glutamate-gated chloride channel isoform X8 [Dinoponera quadriceps]|uniref:Glutamate-gated chloride channel isoform X8 n=1 Tax=Dinoponera quadriceps TaxID=609295 RepID=A0A6P3Y2N2_DINQU|nr:PREDICTED: glutamate-gated chloride channel isoform X8 [Dinoponera quadriceps]